MADRPADDTSLIDRYWSLVDGCVGSEGVNPTPVLSRRADGQVTATMLDLPNQNISGFVHQNFIADLAVREVIYGVDRSTKPGQGTEFQDVFTVYWWVRLREEDYGFRFGVIDYRPGTDRIVRPINWDNRFWIEAMRKEIESAVLRVDHGIETAAAKLGLTPEDMKEMLQEIRAETEGTSGSLRPQDILPLMKAKIISRQKAKGVSPKTTL